MDKLYESAKPSVEDALLKDLSLDVPWSLIEYFSTLKRDSGTEDERKAAHYISEQLNKFGIPHQVYEPDLFISLPVSAYLRVENQEINARPLSFSVSTGAQGISGEVVYMQSVIPEGSSPLGVQPRYVSPSGEEVDVRDKIILVEGFGFEGAAYHFEQRGAKGLIYINPGEYIHSGICTTIWGAPDLDSAPRQPKIPVIVINGPDGQALKSRVSSEKTEAKLIAELREGWVQCPLIVAEIEGQLEPERFLLVHGHYDSWYVGIGDNAVGNATLLELARVFNKHRKELSRSLKIAWWPGHSTGRYAGSTWFADTFGLSLQQNCIAQVNIDSPGCRWATEYYDVSWMKEAENFCIKVIKDATGKIASGRRSLQAGDYSFNNIGLTGFFMLLSSMPRELLQEKGYYPVGGCGGNIEWHTEYDTIEIADPDNLMRDLRVYVVALQRVINNPVHPFDFRDLAHEFRSTLSNYAENAGNEGADFSPAFEALESLESELNKLYSRIGEMNDYDVKDPKVRAVNDAILNLARLLIPINFTRHGRFRNEPSIPVPPLPDLAPSLEIGESSEHLRHVTRTHLQRGINRVAFAFDEAAKVARNSHQQNSHPPR